jgi:hypothetical protein
VLHDIGEELEHVYFPHAGMVSLVAVMQSGATVETVTIGRSGVIGASAGLGQDRPSRARSCNCRYAVAKHNSDRTFPPSDSVPRRASKLEEV